MAASINLKVTSDFQQASGDLKKFGTITEAETARIKKFQDSFKGEQIDKFIDKNRRSAAAVKATRGPVEAMQAEYKGLQKEMERLIKRGLDPQDEKLLKLKTRYNQLQGEMKQNNSQQKKNNQTQQTSIKNLAGIAAGLFSVAQASQFLKASAVDFAEYSKEIANVNTLISITDEEFQALDSSLTDMSVEFAIQKKELSAGVYQALSAGAEDLGSALNVVREASVLAKGALIDNAASVDILTTAMNAYGPEVQSAADITDDYFTIIKEGKINGEELSQSIGKSVSLFAAAKLPLEELGAGIATLTKVGVPAAETTTQLNGIVNAFLKPTEALTAAINDYGFASGSALLESEGFGGALEFIQSTSSGSLEEISKLIPNVRGLRGALAAGAKDGAVYNDILKEFEGNSGAAAEALERQTDGFAKDAFQLEQARVKLTNMRIEIGEKVLPAFVNFIEIIEKGIPIIAGLTAALLVFLAVTKGAAAIQILTAAFRGLTLAIASNPIGAIAAVITLVLVPAIIWLVKNWDLVVIVMSTTIQKLQEQFKLFGSNMSSIWTVAINSLKIKFLELASIIIDKVFGGMQKFLTLAEKIPFVGDKFANLNDNIDDLKEGFERIKTEAISASEEIIASSKKEREEYKLTAAENIANIEKESAARLANLSEAEAANEKFNTAQEAAVKESEEEKTKIITKALSERLDVLNNKEVLMLDANIETFSKFLKSRIEQERIAGNQRVDFLKDELKRIGELENISADERKAAMITINRLMLEDANKTADKVSDAWQKNLSSFESGLSSALGLLTGPFASKIKDVFKDIGSSLSSIGAATGNVAVAAAGAFFEIAGKIKDTFENIRESFQVFGKLVADGNQQLQSILLSQEKDRLDKQGERLQVYLAEKEALLEASIERQIEAFDAVAQDDQRVFEESLQRIDALEEAKKAAFSNELKEITALEDAKLEAFINTLSMSEKLALRSAGVIYESTVDRLDRERIAAEDAGDTELEQLLRNELEIEKIRANTEKQRQQIRQDELDAEKNAAEEREEIREKEQRSIAIAADDRLVMLANVEEGREEAAAEREKAEKDYRNKVARWEYKKAVFDKEVSVSEAKAAGAAALAALPWYTSRADRREVSSLYSTLIDAVESVFIPPPPAFAQGGSFLTSGPQDIRVGDNIGGVERVTVEPVSSSGANVQGGGFGGGPITIMIDGHEFRAFMKESFEDRTIPVDRGALVG